MTGINQLRDLKPQHFTCSTADSCVKVLHGGASQDPYHSNDHVRLARLRLRRC